MDSFALFLLCCAAGYCWLRALHSAETYAALKVFGVIFGLPVLALHLVHIIATMAPRAWNGVETGPAAALAIALGFVAAMGPLRRKGDA